MKTFIYKIIILFSFFNVAYADIKIDGGLYNTNIEVFFINDLNLLQSGNAPLIFWLNITNDYTESKNVFIKFIFRYISSSSINGGDLVIGQTESFDLQPGLITITNQDLFSNSSNYSLDDPQINEDAANDLVQSILSSGKLPAGKYEFIITVVEQNGEIYDEEIIELNLSNPTALDLISPGMPAAMTNLLELYTTLPFFRWESDAHEFRLRICEKLSMNSSPEDVMENEPRLEQVVYMTSYQYPASGVFPLEEGKTYFWQVFAITHSSNGVIELPSEIWGFKIANLSNAQLTMTHLQVVSYLRLILGSDMFDHLFEEGGALADFSATGVVLKNGASINLEELNALINKIFSGEIKIKGFAVE